MTDKSNDIWRELVFGIARPVGIDRDGFISALMNELSEYNYECIPIRLSDLLGSAYQGDTADTAHQTEPERIGRLMELGDTLCAEAETGSAVALLGVARISIERESRAPDSRRIAYIIDSIKRVDEVTQLKQIYSDHYFQFGLQSSVDKRKARLRDQERSTTFDKSDGEIETDVVNIMNRDQREDDTYGQNIMRAFPMSDVFINTDDDYKQAIARVMGLLFSSPIYSVPTTEEYGMQLADVSSTRSPELGLKVGAAILTNDRQRVVSMGVNIHPEDRQKSPEFDASKSEIGRLVLDTMKAISSEYLSEDAQKRLADAPDQLTRELISGALRGTKITDLTEFQPTVHAEMSALLDAMRDGASLDDVTMYVTAYPCHGCAKHLVDLRLPVVYLEPYPKSRAAAMYGNTVDQTFRVFSGIAPWRYQDVFRVGNEDRKTPEGNRKTWTREQKSEASPRVSADLTLQLVREREATAVKRLPDPSGGSAVSGSDDTPR